MQQILQSAMRASDLVNQILLFSRQGEHEKTPINITQIKILLPVSESERPAGVQEDKPISGGEEHILFVDDEPPLIDIAKKMLEPLGYRVTAITDSPEAWALFQADPGQFDLVITDKTMPHMTGLELSQKMIAMRPELPVIMCTGYSEDITPDQALKSGIKALLHKPIIKKNIAEAIHRALGRTG